ncbi:MAG: protein kinase [Chloroflexi bacterium]|nr:protein kinase [Chloroflexota bacterium]
MSNNLPHEQSQSDLPEENAPHIEETVPDKIDDYEILDKLGEGSFANVYLARNPSLGTQVALKVLKQQYALNPRFLDDFLQEARLVARDLKHSSIVQVYDVKQSRDGEYYIVMEYASEGRLTKYEGKGRTLPFQTLCKWIQQIAEALDYAHKQGIFHRDVKPSNILLGENENIKLADFGIARVQQASTVKYSTSILGTEVYMAPEQALPNYKINASADVYAFAIVIYELFMGELPFDGKGVYEITQSKNTKQPKPMTSKNIPAPVQRIIFKALNADPSRRYNSALAFAKELIDALKAWEKETSQKEVFQSDFAQGTVAMDSGDWYKARDFLQKAQQLRDTPAIQHNLDFVQTEITRLEAWDKYEECRIGEDWDGAIEALNKSLATNPYNTEELNIALVQMKRQQYLRQLYRDAVTARDKEQYSIAITKLTELVTEEPEYRNGEALDLLNKVRQTEAQSETLKDREEALFALVERDLATAASRREQLRTLAPNGEYGVGKFLEKFEIALQTRLEEVKKSDEHLITYDQLLEQSKNVEGDLNRLRERNAKVEDRLSKLQTRLGTQLLRYAESLVASYEHFAKYQDNFIVKRTIAGYSDQVTNLAQIAREVVAWGQELQVAYTAEPEPQEKE